MYSTTRATTQLTRQFLSLAGRLPCRWQKLRVRANAATGMARAISTYHSMVFLHFRTGAVMSRPITRLAFLVISRIIARVCSSKTHANIRQSTRETNVSATQPLLLRATAIAPSIIRSSRIFVIYFSVFRTIVCRVVEQADNRTLYLLLDDIPSFNSANISRDLGSRTDNSLMKDEQGCVGSARSRVVPSLAYVIARH